VSDHVNHFKLLLACYLDLYYVVFNIFNFRSHISIKSRSILSVSQVSRFHQVYIEGCVDSVYGVVNATPDMQGLWCPGRPGYGTQKAISGVAFRSYA